MRATVSESNRKSPREGVRSAGVAGAGGAGAEQDAGQEQALAPPALTSARSDLVLVQVHGAWHFSLTPGCTQGLGILTCSGPEPRRVRGRLHEVQEQLPHLPLTRGARVGAIARPHIRAYPGES